VSGDDDALEPLVRSLTSAAGKDRVPQNSNKSNWKAKVKSPKKKRTKTEERRRRRRDTTAAAVKENNRELTAEVEDYIR